VLDETHQTIAEILRHNGYQTYLFSANPHVSALMNFQQGFDDCDHPWDEDHREQALELVRGKIAPADRSTELSESLSSGPVDAWHLKASGELGRQGLEAWLEERDPQRPFFAFLNYMEAHWPLLPQERFRRQVMDPGTMRESYEVDHSWLSMWKYVFGFQEYSARQLEVISATYDACIAELDVLFYDLMQSLEARGLLENTIIIVTSDHGEHLGEHRLMDHQFSLYEPLIRVPLLVRAPGRLEPGREARPVMNYDLFPTLLELCGVAQPEGLQSQAVSLLAPLEHRQRFAEYPSTMRTPIEKMSQLYSGWDPSPWQRRLRVLVEEPYKYIVGSDGRQELYDIAGDPAELRDLMSSQPEIARRMAAALNDYLRKLRLHAGGKAPSKQMTPIEREVMRSLGYVDD
jgi:arylsulfatase A-like enzyme